MEFRAYAKAVKADFSKREITLTFTVSMDEETAETATELAQYTMEDAGPVDLVVSPRQPSLMNVTLTAKTRTAA
jgi:hypothetical protein